MYVPMPSLYLFVKQLPRASRTGELTKFSLAINSNPFLCRSSSNSIRLARTGSNSCNDAFFVVEDSTDDEDDATIWNGEVELMDPRHCDDDRLSKVTDAKLNAFVVKLAPDDES